MRSVACKTLLRVQWHDACCRTSCRARNVRAVFEPAERQVYADVPDLPQMPTTTCATHAGEARTLVVDSYAAAAELVTGLVGDGVHFICTALPTDRWAFSVSVPPPETLDALLVLASRAAARSPGATAVGALVSR